MSDFSLLGSFADLEWLGDLSWNMGCIMVSEQHCDSLNVFEEIPVTTQHSNGERSRGESQKVHSQGGKTQSPDTLESMTSTSSLSIFLNKITMIHSYK